MELGHGLTIDDDAVAAFCASHRVHRLALFGSLLRPDFGDDSDIDVLVEFEPGQSPGLIGIASMEIELEQLLARKVDLRSIGDLSRYFRQQVRSDSVEIYAA